MAQRQGLQGKGAPGISFQIRVRDSGWNPPARSPVCTGKYFVSSYGPEADIHIQDAPEDEQSVAQRPKRGGKVKPVLRGKQSYLAYKVGCLAIFVAGQS